jgi:peptide/nickel transport system ATP-binding protein/oligopeptide transport system ATP-binding protein
MSVHAEPLLQINQLVKHFSLNSGFLERPRVVKAVNNISLSIWEGETYGLVGESGCGKSTTGRLVLRLIEPTAGEVRFQGQNVLALSTEELRKTRKDMQMVFQDPFSALNPRIRVGTAIRETMDIFAIGEKQDRKVRVYDILEKVGLQREHYDRYPHEFSGGQRQRIVLARALAVGPKFIVCDEAVSALDVSTQSQIINLLEKLQDEMQLTYLFIAHNLSVVRHISDRVGVMYLGNLMEEAATDTLFARPLHPYTQALLSAVPHPSVHRKRDRIVLYGDIPSPLNLPSGCVFHTRCPRAVGACRDTIPELREVDSGHKVACHKVQPWTM